MKTLQIDVTNVDETKQLVECNIYIDGRCCKFYTSTSNYQALIYDGIFLRNGKTRDSANVLNTTNVFVEDKTMG